MQFRYVKRHSIWRLPAHVLGFRDVKHALTGIPVLLATFFVLLLATGNIVLTLVVTLVLWLVLNIVYASSRKVRYGRHVVVKIEEA